jgi:hypothetical protein
MKATTRVVLSTVLTNSHIAYRKVSIVSAILTNAAWIADPGLLIRFSDTLFAEALYRGAPPKPEFESLEEVISQ